MIYAKKVDVDVKRTFFHFVQCAIFISFSKEIGSDESEAHQLPHIVRLNSK